MTAVHALLIGIDHHEPARFADGLPIRPLLGAVNDVARMRWFLESGPFAVPAERIRELVSPQPWGWRASRREVALPTRENLVLEIRSLGDRGAPGDQVLIHYSGHGARLPTAVPEAKGPAARDECLVPSDVGAAGGGFLRDVEIHALIQELAAKGLVVTLILDCCHAGGLTRSWLRSHVRGLGELPFQAPPESPLGSWTELATRLCATAAVPAREEGSKAWRRLDPEPGWFPMPHGCVMIAACRSTELAREYLFGGEGYNGALTHLLLRTLGDSQAALTYRELHHRLVGRVRSLSHQQTPALRGEGDGIFMTGEQRIARPEHSAALRSELVDPASSLQVSRVRMVARDRSNTDHPREWSQLRKCLADGASPLLMLAERSDPEPDLTLELDSPGCVRILEGQGRSTSGDPVELATAGAVARIIDRLRHLAHYLAVRRLTGPGNGAMLARSVEVELFALARIEDWQRLPRRVPVNPSEVPIGSLLCLLIRNLAEHELSIAVLDLRPDWEIQRIHPYPGDGDSATLDAGAEQPVFFRAELPEGMDEGRDRLQLLIATRPMATQPLEHAAAGLVSGAPSDRDPPVVASVDGGAAGGSERSVGASTAGRWGVQTFDLVLRRPRPKATESWWMATG